MAKSELFNNQLIPWVLVAGVLSGGLWRPPPPPTQASRETGCERRADRGRIGPRRRGFSDLRPVMESLDATLGRAPEGANGSELQSSAGVALQPKGEARRRTNRPGNGDPPDGPGPSDQPYGTVVR